MPYNPGGVFSLVASYFANPGTTIRTEQHNPVFEDVGSALSQVLLRDGRAPMTGALNMNGFAINNVVAGNSPSSVATLAQAMPIGAVIDYALKTPPAGWLLCFAQVLLPNTPYQTLRTALIGDGFPYGQDGSGNPKLPDARGTVTAGFDAMGGSAAGRIVGALFGGIVGTQYVVLSPAELPAVNVGVNVSGFVSGSMNSTQANILFQATPYGSQGGGAPISIPGAQGSVTVTGTLSGSMSGSTSPLGSSAGHNNLQPTLVMNKIIKVSYDV